MLDALVKSAHVSGRTLLFVGAHPDDETFGPGGTLAAYAAAGVRVAYACATRGEAGAGDPEHVQGFPGVGEMRWAELACAAKELRLTDVVGLGYRDSGMSGAPDNQHPDALIRAPLDEVTRRVVGVIRELRPQVVITFDPIGGYRHPDHIAVHQAAARAFEASGDPRRFTDCGPAFAAQKLYYHVIPRRLLRVAIRLLPLLGRDPRRFGRNHDIDLVSLTTVDFPVHARIRVGREAAARKGRASACHRSQLSGGPPRSGFRGVIARMLGRVDCYMRAYPPAASGLRERDLFEGVV